MPHLFSKRQAMLAVALALSTTVAAHAQNASGSASLTNLRIQLIDLDPADGVAPKLTLATPDKYSTSASVSIYSSDSSLSDSKYFWGYGPFDVARSTVEGAGKSLSDGKTWQSSAEYAHPVGGSLWVSSSSYSSLSFKLTRNTRMIVTADASVDGDGYSGRNRSEASVSLSGRFDDGLETPHTDELSWAGAKQDEQLSISMQTLYGSLYGWLTVRTGATVEYNVAAVPEPATNAMLLAGVAVLGVYARRKAKRPA
ncbi:MAG: PEP-CTERM sorting domain-containing protein [Gammaproteobacteria bacterium]